MYCSNGTIPMSGRAHCTRAVLVLESGQTCMEQWIFVVLLVSNSLTEIISMCMCLRLTEILPSMYICRTSTQIMIDLIIS